MAAALPWIRSRWFDQNGKPLVGGKVWFYQAGTTVPKTSYTDSTGLTPNTNPVILDANGEADIWLIPGNYKMVLMNKNDVVIFTRDNIKPNDGGGGGITDGDYIFDGYSARFNEQFGPTLGLMDTLNKIIKITYTAPSISLSASGSGTIYEKGASVASTTLTATVTKKSNPIAEVRFYKVGTGTPLATKTGTIPGGGTETYTYSTAFTDTVQFNAKVDDTMVGTDGPTTVTSNTVTFTYVYPYYVGAGAGGLSGAGIAALTKLVITSNASLLRTITVNGSQKMYFAYPASYGDLTSILDVNGFNVLPSWTKSTKSITGLDATSQSYTCYESNNTPVAGSYDFTFKR